MKQILIIAMLLIASVMSFAQNNQEVVKQAKECLNHCDNITTVYEVTFNDGRTCYMKYGNSTNFALVHSTANPADFKVSDILKITNIKQVDPNGNYNFKYKRLINKADDLGFQKQVILYLMGTIDTIDTKNPSKHGQAPVCGFGD